MNLPRAYYLERSPLTGELQSIDDADKEQNFYCPGELYFLVQRGTNRAEKYALKVISAISGVVDDRLEHIGGGQYRLRFTGSNLKTPEPIFSTIRAGDYRGTLAWILIEQNPDYLDQLEQEYGYNPIGDASIGESFEGR